jgi:hypothetical protein
MRTASLGIGILAGVIGIAVAVLFVMYGNVLMSHHQASSDYATTVGGMALLCSVSGAIGAAIALGRPRLGAAFMVLAAGGLFMATAVFALVAGPLFLISAVLALLGSRRMPGTA